MKRGYISHTIIFRAELYVSPYQVYGELDIKAQTLRGVNLLRYKDVVTRLGILTKGFIDCPSLAHLWPVVLAMKVVRVP